MSDITIENIVCFIELKDSFDIEHLSEKIPNANYNPNEFEGLSIKHSPKKIVTIILSNGKILCTGAKKKEEAENAIKKTIDKLNNIGLSIEKDYKVEIESIVASTDIKKELHLSSISNGLMLQNVHYEPKEFPGLIYREKDSCIVLLLFSSGKIVCTGAKDFEEATESIDMIKEKLTSIGAL